MIIQTTNIQTIAVINNGTSGTAIKFNLINRSIIINVKKKINEAAVIRMLSESMSFINEEWINLYFNNLQN